MWSYLIQIQELADDLILPKLSSLVKGTLGVLNICYIDVDIWKLVYECPELLNTPQAGYQVHERVPRLGINSHIGVEVRR